MKAAVYYENGGPDVFRYEEVPDPQPGPDDVLMRVEVIGIQGADPIYRQSFPPPTVPYVVGYQCAGTVVAVGEHVADIAVGDRVVSVGPDGAYAQLRAVNQMVCWVIPDGLSTRDAACVPTEFATASHALLDAGRLVAGETVLVQAGAGGVGLAAVQLAKRAGARVLATASSDERLERLKEYGLDGGINYATIDFVAASRALTDGRGVDIVLDTVGGPVMQKSVASLAYRGRYVGIGAAGRADATTLDISTMEGQNQVFTTYAMSADLARTPEPLTVIPGLLDDAAAGKLKVVVDRSFALADAAEAHAFIESRQAFGRVVLTVG